MPVVLSTSLQHPNCITCLLLGILRPLYRIRKMLFFIFFNFHLHCRFYLFFVVSSDFRLLRLERDKASSVVLLLKARLKLKYWLFSRGSSCVRTSMWVWGGCAAHTTSNDQPIIFCSVFSASESVITYVMSFWMVWSRLIKWTVILSLWPSLATFTRRDWISTAYHFDFMALKGMWRISLANGGGKKKKLNCHQMFLVFLPKARSINDTEQEVCMCAARMWWVSTWKRYNGSSELTWNHVQFSFSQHL